MTLTRRGLTLVMLGVEGGERLEGCQRKTLGVILMGAQTVTQPPLHTPHKHT